MAQIIPYQRRTTTTTPRPVVRKKKLQPVNTLLTHLNSVALAILTIIVIWDQFTIAKIRTTNNIMNEKMTCVMRSDRIIDLSYHEHMESKIKYTDLLQIEKDKQYLQHWCQ